MLNRKAPVGSGVIACCLMIFALAGCRREQPSQIVQLVKNSGAGELRTARTESIVEWFERHPKVALKAETLCKPAFTRAQAKWPQTTGGRVCSAARQVAGFIEWQRDLRNNNERKTFQGGSK